METNETSTNLMMPNDGEFEIIQKNSMEEVFATFLQHYQNERTPSKNTLKSLQYIIPNFLHFCLETRNKSDVKGITEEDVILYLNTLNIRTSSRKLHLRFITLFFNYLFKLKLIDVKLQTISYKGPSDIPRASQKEIDDKEINTMIKKRRNLSDLEKTIFDLLVSRPLRIGELANLKVGSVNLLNKTFTIYKSKNHKTRTLSIPQMAYDGLFQLIQNKNPDDLVFELKERSMYNVIDRIYKKLGIEKHGRSSHAFRHKVIMDMLYKLKRDISVVAEDAGNTKKTILSHYTERIPTEELRSAEKEMDRLRWKNVVL